MAADLQDPPALIRDFVDRWRSGHDVVWGARTGRDDGAVRARGMAMFYRLVRRFAIPTYPKGGTGSFCLISRPVIDAFRQCNERNRLTFGLIAWSGFHETSVPYHRPRRLIGASSWTVRKMVKAALDTFISFSSLPIRTISFLGLAVSALSFVFGVYVFINQVFFGTRVQGWTSVMLAVLMLGGVQLLMIGVLGEYLQRILEEARGRPLYIVERTLGLEQAAPAEARIGRNRSSLSIGILRLPDFIIGGAPRSGTTWLYALLDRHPDVFMARPRAPEPKFFLVDHLYEKGLQYYSRYVVLHGRGRTARGRKKHGLSRERPRGANESPATFRAFS